MIARTQLAAFVHERGTNRDYAVFSNGEVRLKASYTKVNNQWVAKKMCVEKKSNIYLIF